MVWRPLAGHSLRRGLEAVLLVSEPPPPVRRKACLENVRGSEGGYFWRSGPRWGTRSWSTLRPHTRGLRVVWARAPGTHSGHTWGGQSSMRGLDVGTSFSASAAEVWKHDASDSLVPERGPCKVWERRPMLAQIGPHAAKLAQIWTNPGRVRPTWRRRRGNFDRSRPKLARNRPTLADAHPGVGPNSLESAKVGRFRDLGRVRQTSGPDT